jgi:hypothetical protein
MATPPAFNLIDFKSQVNSRGLSKTNRFEVQILPPKALANKVDNAKLVSLFCEITNLPGMSISTKGQRIYGAPYQKPVSSDFGGDSIVMTFYMDNGFDVKAFFDAWMFNVVNPNSFNVNYQENYVSQIKITQLDENDVDQYSVFLEDAFPRAMNMMEMNMSATNQTHKLTITFAYRRWFAAQSTTMISSFKSPGFPPNLQNPKGTRSISTDTIS